MGDKQEYYIDADRLRVMYAPEGTSCGNLHQVVCLCATDAGGMKVAEKICNMLNGSSAPAQRPLPPSKAWAEYDAWDDFCEKTEPGNRTMQGSCEFGYAAGKAFGAALRAPEAADAGDVAWPDGCHDPNSCARHKSCMYQRCRHEGAWIRGEINPDEIAASLSDAGTRACTCHPSEAPVPCQHKYAFSECQASALASTELCTPISEVQRLREALDAIRIYGNDTLSGRADGPDDREWQREAVREMARRARAALSEEVS